MFAINTVEMEIILSKFFNRRRNLIVPNVSWGMFNHECDLIILTQSGYAYEVEIKISKADLVKDKQKRHNHYDPKIKYLYFAVPDFLIEGIEEHIPERSGIISISEKELFGITHKYCRLIKNPVSIKNPYRFTENDRYKLARLGALRIWTLKNNIKKLKGKLEECQIGKGE